MFLFIMTGSSSILALKLVMRHDELESVNHGVLLDVIVEISENQFLSDPAQKVGL